MPWSIEFREFNILGGGGHNYFGLRNETGLRVGKINSLANDSITAQPKAVALPGEKLRKNRNDILSIGSLDNLQSLIGTVDYLKDMKRMRRFKEVIFNIARYSFLVVSAFLTFQAIAEPSKIDLVDKLDHSEEFESKRQASINQNYSHRMGFLNSLNELIETPPLTIEKISKNFGWLVVKQFTEPRLSRKDTYFGLYPGASWYAATFVEGSGNNLNIQLKQQILCVTSQDVLEKFGNQFAKRMAIVHPYPDTSKLSEVVKNNLAIFNHGPAYQISNSPWKTTLYFSFVFSECLESITIIQSKPEEAIK